VYRLTQPEKPSLYLKVARGSGSSLRREYDILKWIGVRLPSPEPLYYMSSGDAEYLLTREVPGTPAYQVQPEEREGAVRVLAFTLRCIHELDADACPYTNTTEERVNALRSTLSQTDQRKLDELAGRAPAETLSFTHGDYCLPNVITVGPRLSGVIDWDHGGLADPYVDLASCLWSLKYNYGERESKDRWMPLFLEVYGLDELDDEKLGFYTGLMALE
jgi:aminoglycoside phosphotransferase